MEKIEEKNITIIDTTLRDGEQTPGVIFNRRSKLKIALMLEKAGVDEIEAGIPVMGEIEQKAISEIVKKVKRSKVTCWCRANDKDIESALKCNTESVHISFPISDIQLNLMGKDLGWLYRLSESIISKAVKRFKYVSVGALDATRCDINTLKSFTDLAYSFGAYRLRVADTVGIATPGNISDLFKELIKNESRMDYEFHGHNDLNMAVANSLSALEAGVKSVSSTINGIGERAGNAATEEIVAALKYGADRKTNIDLKALVSICDFVEKVSGIKIHNLKPITGKNINTHESGIHVNGLLKDPLSFQPFNPADIGREEAVFVAGKHSGSNGLKHILENNGYFADKRSVKEMIKKIQKRAEINRNIKIEDLLDMKKIYEAIELS